MYSLGDFIKWLITHICNFLSGGIAIFVSYFAPLKLYLQPIENIIYIMVLTILIDFLFGLIASLKEGRGIKSRRMWRTGYKLLFSVVLVSLMYSIDKEMNMIELHKVIAWLFTGFEFWSILENLARISNMKIFKLLQKVMSDKIEDITGIDLDEELKSK